MNREKLAAISAMLRKLPEELDDKTKFNMGIWGRSARAGQGIAGCAIAWAIHKRILPELELVANTVLFRSTNPEDDLFAEPVTGFEAIQRVLGIDRLDSIHLFHPISYRFETCHIITPEMVADRIDAFLARG